jgi:hypothetical protein
VSQAGDSGSSASPYRLPADDRLDMDRIDLVSRAVPASSPFTPTAPPNAEDRVIVTAAAFSRHGDATGHSCRCELQPQRQLPRPLQGRHDRISRRAATGLVVGAGAKTSLRTRVVALLLRGRSTFPICRRKRCSSRLAALASNCSSTLGSSSRACTISPRSVGCRSWRNRTDDDRP